MGPPDGPDHVKIGITDYATGALGDIVFVELPEVGAELTAMGTFGSVEAVKTVSDLFSPVTGRWSRSTPLSERPDRGQPVAVRRRLDDPRAHHQSRRDRRLC